MKTFASAIVAITFMSPGCSHVRPPSRTAAPDVEPPPSGALMKPVPCIAESNDPGLSGPPITLQELDEPTREWAMQVSRQLQANTQGLVTCYKRRLAENPTIKGIAVLTFAVGPTGSVTQAAVRFSDPAETTLGRCMAAAACGWHFPPGPNQRAGVFDQTVSLAPEPAH